jgi:hypothetical protein
MAKSTAATITQTMVPADEAATSPRRAALSCPTAAVRAAIAADAVPFLRGDSVKALLAAGLLPASWGRSTASSRALRDES